MVRGLIVLLLAACAGGCGIGRYRVSDPEKDRVLRVEQGDRFYFTLKEDSSGGARWKAKSDDPDAEVSVSHAAGEAGVCIRIHRGFDGPATITFTRARPHASKPEKTFVISCYRTAFNNDVFWK